MISRLLALVCAGLLVACASSTGQPSPAGDASGSGDASDRDDVGRDTSDVDAATDVGDVGVDTAPDVASDVAADGSGDAADVGPDSAFFDCPDAGDECAPTSVTCAPEGEAIRYCSRCGYVLEDEPCDELEVCDTVDGRATCRPCVGAECPEQLECEPSTRSCRDYRNVQICDADGNIDTVSPCPAGRRCFDGSCGPPGNSTGETCQVDYDVAAPETGCIGQLCLCSPDFVSEFGGDQCGGDLTRGYCSTRDCASNGCDNANEVCADFSAGGRHAGLSFCVMREGCSRAGATCGDRAGMSCIELPGRPEVGGPIEWEMACWQAGIRRIGDTCTSDSECAGGQCETRFVSGTSVSYCTAPCGDIGGCPSNAVCVRPGREDDDPYLCLARAEATACPRLDSDPLHIRSTAFLPRYGGGSAEACWFAGG